MKTRISKISMLCLLMLTTISISLAAQNDDLKKMVGKWSYTMEDPMGGGSFDGTITIAEKDGAYIATVTSPMGDMNTTALKLESGKYVGTLDIPDFEMKIAFKFKDADTLTQEIIFPSGNDFPALPPVDMKRAK
jgi:hypothetical protein